MAPRRVVLSLHGLLVSALALGCGASSAQHPPAASTPAAPPAAAVAPPAARPAAEPPAPKIRGTKTDAHLRGQDFVTRGLKFPDDAEFVRFDRAEEYSPSTEAWSVRGKVRAKNALGVVLTHAYRAELFVNDAGRWVCRYLQIGDEVVIDDPQAKSPAEVAVDAARREVAAQQAARAREAARREADTRIEAAKSKRQAEEQTAADAWGALRAQLDAAPAWSGELRFAADKLLVQIRGTPAADELEKELAGHRKLALAKQFVEKQNKSQARKWLTETAKEFPGTLAGREAEALLKAL